MGWLFLAAAVLSEVCGTLSLRVASGGKNAWYACVAVGYLLAFTFLSLALGEGVALGVAYGIWAAAGVALTSVASKFLFKEALTPIMMFGIVLVMAGVLLIETGASH